ncbi:MAG TPA: hypothetical protein DDZ80_22040 [Cyanobacteria bacterium UBA8803]|nr:hypothetical protein [Cyanobacteria bacterium UBA9273]HBL61012.1 hypothetical protein [Cyanobacteria bacterium UBA8803]
MGYSSLLFLLPISLSLPLLAASATDVPTGLAQSRTPADFWPQAEQLVEQQLNLINLMGETLTSPDMNRTEMARGRLFLHLGKVERFLKSQYRIPQFLCNNGTVSPEVPADLTLPQREVYCALYVSSQQLDPMLSLLDRRLPMLAGLAATNPLTDERSQLRGRYNYQIPVQPRFAPVPDFPEPEPPVIGLPAKTPIADYSRPPLPPAIAPSEEAIATLEAARQKLLSALPAFPDSNRMMNLTPNAAAVARANYGILPLEQKQYAQFLAQPNTGIAHILLAQSYHPDPNQLRNRLQPSISDQFPFVPLLTRANSLLPRLTLEIEDGNFRLPLPGLNYGFMVNLGEVALENLNPNLQKIPNLSPLQRDLFLNYVPPLQLDALQVDRQRFLTGKEGLGFVPPVSPPASTQLPIVLNNTYLLRSIQFQLPEALLTREPISRAQRRHLPELLKTPSSDVLVAFQPIQRRFDGSYTVLWRLLYQFPDPQIEDLEKYVELE